MGRRRCCGRERRSDNLPLGHYYSWTLLETALPTSSQLGRNNCRNMPSDAELVTASWNTAAGLGVETVGTLFFKRVFEIAPGALQLFSFKDEPNVSRARSGETRVAMLTKVAHR